MRQAIRTTNLTPLEKYPVQTREAPNLSMTPSDKKNEERRVSGHSSDRPNLTSIQAMAAAANQFQSPLKENLIKGLELNNRAFARQVSEIVGRNYSDLFAAQQSQLLRELNPASRQLIQSLYSDKGLRNLTRPAAEEPRKNRTPRAFTAIHAAEVGDVKGLIKALSKISSKHASHDPIWRGQGKADWPIRSTLYRAIAGPNPERVANETELIKLETEILSKAMDWGLAPHEISPYPLYALAELQHAGAPTRLLDVTKEPEVAAWFAVEDPKHDNDDGMIIAWGQRPRISKNSTGGSPTSDILNADPSQLPWHQWDQKERAERGWGTGSRNYTWFPPAPNTRMRVQRGGFMIESGPILLEAIVETINAKLSESTGQKQDWRQSELEVASSIVGLPSPIDRKTKANDLAIAPMFTIIIKAEAKPSLRRYLATRGIEYRSMYPDLPGMVAGLRRSHS